MHPHTAPEPVAHREIPLCLSVGSNFGFHDNDDQTGLAAEFFHRAVETLQGHLEHPVRTDQFADQLD